MSRLRAALDAAGRWLLAAWPLAMRSRVERQERRLRIEIRHQELSLMSLARELVRLGEQHEGALREVDDLTRRLAVAVRERDRARAGLVQAQQATRERAQSVTARADAVLAAIDEAVGA